MKFNLICASALIAVTFAGPALAQSESRNAGRPSASAARHHHYLSSVHSRSNSRHSWNGAGARDDSAFWPAGVAGAVVGGAIGTAGAIATAPFRALDANAWDAGYAGSGGDINESSIGTYNAGQIAGNWVACAPPGSAVRDADGSVHRCR
jgi:hypothetical protein